MLLVEQHLSVLILFTSMVVHNNLTLKVINFGGAAQNVNVTAGMSTYHDLDIRRNLTVVGNSSFNPDQEQVVV